MDSPNKKKFKRGRSGAAGEVCLRETLMPKWCRLSKIFGIFDRQDEQQVTTKIYGRLVDFYYKDRHSNRLPMSRFEEGTPLQQQRTLVKIYEFYFHDVGFAKWT